MPSDFAAGIDYRRLLWNYMNVVEEAEGGNYMPSPDDDRFTDAERAELEFLDDEPEYLTPTASEATAIGADFITDTSARLRAAASPVSPKMGEWEVRTLCGAALRVIEAAASPKVASDTAPGVREAAKAMADAWDDDPDSEAVCEARNQIRAALAASPTASDTDTAIPGGEVELLIELAERYRGEGDWNGAYHTMKAAYSLAAASPKPDTDTPVAPGVEGVRLGREAIANLIAGVCLDYENGVPGVDAGDCYRIADEILAAKPIAGMDAGEVDK